MTFMESTLTESKPIFLNQNIYFGLWESVCRNNLITFNELHIVCIKCVSYALFKFGTLVQQPTPIMFVFNRSV